MFDHSTLTQEQKASGCPFKNFFGWGKKKELPASNYSKIKPIGSAVAGSSVAGSAVAVSLALIDPNVSLNTSTPPKLE